ncbi:MAG: hypothetical protein MZV63_47730 [Marinilabiliales bacterium]|nr:hypothetical protein [Marinilabiliales bacterium]
MKAPDGTMRAYNFSSKYSVGDAERGCFTYSHERTSTRAYRTRLIYPFREWDLISSP